jgi:hypothetical protein
MASHRKKALSAKDPRRKRAPPFTPTQHMRESVEAQAAYGIPHDVIARLTLHPKTGKPISEQSLHRYFGHELAVGKWKLVATVAQTLAKSAKGYPAEYDGAGRIIRAERQSSDTACMFLLKSIGGYRDRTEIQHTGKDGAPASVVIAIVPAEAKL